MFTTEGQLSAGRYKVLDDPRRLFAFQNLAPVIRRDLVRKYGKRLSGPLDALSAKLTTDAMRSMNAAVDLKGEKPADVARRFLQTGRPAEICSSSPCIRHRSVRGLGRTRGRTWQFRRAHSS